MKYTLMLVSVLLASATSLLAQPTSEFIPDSHTDGLYHLNAGIGNLAVDSSSNGLDGLIGGQATWTTGRFGNALSFAGGRNNCAISSDGSTASGTILDDPSLHFAANDFTLEAMALLNNSGTNYDLPVIYKGQSSNIAYYALQIELGTRKPLFNGSHAGVEWTVRSPDPISLGEWHHLAGVRSGNIFILYVDGAEKARQTLSVGSTDNTDPLYIGHWPFGSPMRYFPGDIDEVRIWNAALDASTIATNAFIQLTGAEANLVALWNFNSCQGSTIADRSSHGLNGTLSGAYSYVTASWTPTASGDRVDLGTSALLCPSILTCEAWIWVDSIHVGSMLIITSAKDFHGYRLFLNNGHPAFDCQNGTYHIAQSLDLLPLNEWHHLAGTFDGQSVRIWVDGIPKATTNGYLSPATYPLFIGTDVTPPYTSDPFWGKIDEVRISDIVRYYDSFVWDIQECSGDTIFDSNHFEFLTLNDDAIWTTQGARGCGLNFINGQAGTDPGSTTMGNGWDQLSLEIRIKVLSPLTTATPVVSRYNYYTTDGFYVLAGREGGHFGSIEGSVSTGPGAQRVVAISPDSTIDDTCWHVIAMTFDKNDSLKLWMDGVEIAAARSDGNPMIISNDPLRFGSNPLMGYPGPFNGYLGGVRIAHSTQLTPLCSPRAVNDVIIQPQGANEFITWSPVIQDSCGFAFCPDLYLVFFENHITEDPDFLAYTTTTNYTHRGVVRFSSSMFYTVHAYRGSLVGLQMVLSENGNNSISRSELFRRLDQVQLLSTQ